MDDSQRNIAVFGSTGSIGASALEVIAASDGRLKATALAAKRRLPELVEQANAFRPRWVIAADADAASDFDWSGLPRECELRVGGESLCEVAKMREIDVVLAAIVGIAGFASTWAAVDAKKTVAIANKETLVAGGAKIIDLAKDRGAPIIPVDSEHSAIFQALAGGRKSEVERVILTASGGPFRDLPLEKLATVTARDALRHPTWNMGRKITVDSATMMNKALEIIEARWLFGLRPEQIEVVVHPQSVVHSMVEFVDGSVLGQLSPPDMKLPIQYALDYPNRFASPAAKMDWTARHDLEFYPPDPRRFPAVALGHEVAKSGGTSGVVLNAANEAAVAAFLGERLAFDKIVPACRGVLESHPFESNPSLERLFELDRWAREEIENWT